MTWLWRALPKSFRASSDRMAQAAGTIFEPGKPPRVSSASRSAETSQGKNRNRPPKLVRRARGREVELADVRHIGHHGAWLVGPLVVGPSWQLGEALVLEDRGDRRRAERLAVAGQGTADVVDREVLLAQGDDLFPQPRSACPGGGLGVPWGRRSPVRADCGTDGRGPGSSPGCTRTGRRPPPRGGRRRRRPARLRTAGGWSWTAPRTGEPELSGPWSYRPWCHDVILTGVRPLMRSGAARAALKQGRTPTPSVGPVSADVPEDVVADNVYHSWLDDNKTNRAEARILVVIPTCSTGSLVSRFPLRGNPG